MAIILCNFSGFTLRVTLTCCFSEKGKKSEKKEYLFKNKKEAIEAFKMLLKDKVWLTISETVTKFQVNLLIMFTPNCGNSGCAIQCIMGDGHEADYQ